jgi:hypothetical protein
MNDLSDIGLLKREFRDVHSVVSRLDTQVRRLVEPQPLRRPACICARLGAVALLARAQKRKPADVAKQAFADDREIGTGEQNTSVFEAAIMPAHFAKIVEMMMEADPEATIHAIGKALQAAQIQRRRDETSSDEAA